MASQQELESTITGVEPSANTTIQTIRKLGARPETAIAPPVPMPEISEYERSAAQRIEVGLITKRQIEAALEEQLRLVEIELAGVRTVIAADEAALKIFNGVR